MTRRQVLGVHAGAALGVAATSPPVAADDRPGQGSLFVVGPLSIAGWFLRAARTAPLGGPLMPLTTPRPEDVAKVLAGCRVYVLDWRTGPAGAGGRLAGPGWPKLAAEGILSGRWQEGDKSYALHVAGVSVGGTVTRAERGVEFRELGRVTVALHLRGSEGRDSADATYVFSSDDTRLVYDVTGAVRPVRPAGNRPAEPGAAADGPRL